MVVNPATFSATSISAYQMSTSAVRGGHFLGWERYQNAHAHPSWGISNLFTIAGGGTARGTLVPLLLHGGRCTAEFVAALSFVYAMPVLTDGDYLNWCCPIELP